VAAVTLSSLNQGFQFLILNFTFKKSGSSKYVILSHVTFNYDLFMEELKKEREREREIRIYKD
jgi:hypothetical protein